MVKKAKVEKVKREVLEGKLLDALEDEGTVAVVCTVEDLGVLIVALELYWAKYDNPRGKSLYDGLWELRDEAFGK